MKNEFGYVVVGWLGEEDYLCCICVARETFFQAPRRRNFVQMATYLCRVHLIIFGLKMAVFFIT